MAHVNVTFNGRQYRLACDDGEEPRLKELAESFARRIEELRTKFGQIGDFRLTLMAALTIADELGESGQTIRRLEEERAGLQAARLLAAERERTTEGAVAAALNAAAERVEAATRKLNQGSAPAVPIG